MNTFHNLAVSVPYLIADSRRLCMYYSSPVAASVRYACDSCREAVCATCVDF